MSLTTAKNYRENLQLARRETVAREMGGFNLHEVYARYDEMGMKCGWGVLAFAGVSAIGLVVQVVRTAGARRREGAWIPADGWSRRGRPS